MNDYYQSQSTVGNERADNSLPGRADESTIIN